MNSLSIITWQSHANKVCIHRSHVYMAELASLWESLCGWRSVAGCPDDINGFSLGSGRREWFTSVVVRGSCRSLGHIRVESARGAGIPLSLQWIVLCTNTRFVAYHNCQFLVWTSVTTGQIWSLLGPIPTSSFVIACKTGDGNDPGELVTCRQTEGRGGGLWKLPCVASK